MAFIKKKILFSILLTLSIPVLKSENINYIEYENNFYKLILNCKTGSIVSLTKEGHNIIYTNKVEVPLFSIRFRDPSKKGQIHEFNAFQSAECKIDLNKDQLSLTFAQFKGINIKVKAKAQLSKNSPFIYWNLSIENNSNYSIDHIDFPNITVPNDLIATGGSGRIFWPAQEGCLIEDMSIREESPWLTFDPIEYPHQGWGGYYPSSTQMQYMAYYNDYGGLYLAAHDELCYPKGIDYKKVSEDQIELIFRLFPGGIGKGLYTIPYRMVIGVFEGDWHDASAIYRDWRETSKMPLPPKIKKNQMLPKWYFESPIVVTYPIRGQKDLGNMSPNKLFFPYTNALKIINRYNDLFNSKIMVLLMHWEGTAPWAPPYVWPPYGGEENYLEFVDSLHQKSNLVGLYGSGIGYTLQSNTDTTYKMYEEYNSKQLYKVMKVAPDGDLATNGVCTGPNAQRIGYDMCPANEFVKEVVWDQIAKIINSKTDYIQYFDQNLGGGSYPCYGTSHGHSYGPGLWQNEEMISIYDGIYHIFQNSSYKPIIGCEAAAAEPYMPYLLFNDARATINLFAGRPVPAYAFVNHEYVNNFMGNQNGVSIAIDIEKSPMNLLQRLAYAFCAGDMLTVILRGNGDINWDWGTTWDVKAPNQKQIWELVRNLNGWRNGIGRDFLVYGKMLKPLVFEGSINVPMITRFGNRNINFPSIFTSNWQTENEIKAQFFVNYLPYEQEITIELNGLKNVELFENSSGSQKKVIDSKEVNIRLEPLTAIMIRYSD